MLCLGSGAIAIGRDVRFGWPTSAEFHSGYLHLEASTPESVVEIGDEAEINNDAYIKSEGAGHPHRPARAAGLQRADLDSDFHDLHPDAAGAAGRRWRPSSSGRTSSSATGRKILKGVTIGAGLRGRRRAASSTRSIPAGVIAAGNPARVVRELARRGRSPPRRSLTGHERENGICAVSAY